jgi:PH domain associated with Beige/BEACH
MSTALSDAVQAGRVHKRWACAELAAVHHARYLLRPAALELFLADRSNALLSFPSPKVPAKPGIAEMPSNSDRLRLICGQSMVPPLHAAVPWAAHHRSSHSARMHQHFAHRLMFA